MSRLPATAHSLLERHPAPALSVEELNDLLAREHPRARFASDHVRERLRHRSDAGQVRLLDPPRRRWASGLLTRAWIVARPASASGRLPTHSLPGRLRESVQALAGLLDPSSSLAWARWSRLVDEEERVRASLGGRTGASESGRREAW